MKKRAVSLVLALVLAASLVTPSLAASDTGEPVLFAPSYQTICTAVFQNAEYDGRARLIVRASPDISRKLLSPLGIFCDVVSLFGVSFLDGVCKVVDYSDEFLDYTDSQMRLHIRLYDAGTNELVWEGVMKNGDIIFLGNDHPNGYRIDCKAYNSSLPFVRIEVVENLDLIR